MVNENKANESASVEESAVNEVASAPAENAESATPKLRVYRKKSTFKGATEKDFWYSATRSDGASIICKFKCPITTESPAFEISNVVGNAKHTPVTDDDGNVIFDNYIYYINSCDFSEIEGVDLQV